MEDIEKLSAPPNLTTLAYTSIKKHILEGKLRSNVRLTEEFFSKKLGISKSPVREALNGLQNEGLIRIEPRRGAYLRTFSIKEVQDLYNLRETLESYAVSIVKIDAQLIKDLRASIERTRQFLSTNDKIRHIEEDVQFHSRIAMATGNMELYRVLNTIQNQIWLFRCQTYDLSSSSAPEAHTSILRALEKRDHAEGVEAMKDHIQNVRKHLVDFLEIDRPLNPLIQIS